MNEKLEEKPLGYWEKESYMLAIPRDYGDNILTEIFERVSKIDGIKLLEKEPYSGNAPGKMVVNYENEDFEIGFYPSNFSLPKVYINKKYYFSEEDINILRNSRVALTFFMKFNKDAKKSFHLQLKIAFYAVPNLIGIMDESAEKMLPRNWVKMTAKSKYTPGPEDIYTVHAVSSEDGEIWLHTHGLCRCGLTELEILESDMNNYRAHYNLLSTFASYLIDKKYNVIPGENGVYIGNLSNNQPIVVTYLPWTKGLKEYKDLKLGNIKDRENAHNSKTGIIFIYKSKEDEENRVYSKPTIYNDLLKEDPIFFLSDEETERIRNIAIERFELLRKDFEKNKNETQIKIGIEENGEKEHIWFELLEIKEDRLKVKLLQEPYFVKSMHKGDIKEYSIKDITDWAVFTKNGTISPEKAYLL